MMIPDYFFHKHMQKSLKFERCITCRNTNLWNCLVLIFNASPSFVFRSDVFTSMSYGARNSINLFSKNPKFKKSLIEFLSFIEETCLISLMTSIKPPKQSKKLKSKWSSSIFIAATTTQTFSFLGFSSQNFQILTPINLFSRTHFL